MVIRKAIENDSNSIVKLLDQLDYEGTEHFIVKKLNQLLNDKNEVLLVAEENDILKGFISIHFIPQIAVEGDFARISYFCVDGQFRGIGIGDVLEKECQRIAEEKGCDRIEVHCHARRKNAHGFYIRQGFVEVPKYFVKLLK